MRVRFGVLGPVAAWTADGAVIALRGPRHRAVLARLVAARRRMVPLDVLIDDLWTVPPAGAAGAVRTFVADLRRALEPGRPPRAPATLLVTEGPGYALRAGSDEVDAWRFTDTVTAAATGPAQQAAQRLEDALTWWRGPAYADFPDAPWAQGERSRLGELWLQAVERLAEAHLHTGQAARVVSDLDPHTAQHPWREKAWRLLALALYQNGRQADALAVLRRARTMLAEQLGLDPSPALARLETDILTHDQRLNAADAITSRVWAAATAAYDRALAADARTRLESTVDIVRGLAVTGGSGLQAAREHRFAAVTAAEQLGDDALTARVIGAYDVPAIWSRVDDPERTTPIVALAARILASPPAGMSEVTRARLMATIAVESRGLRDPAARAAAHESLRIARSLADPGLLGFALNGLYMQSFDRCGQAADRDAIGGELIELSARHDLPTYEVLGHLIRLQTRSALGDFTGADAHAEAADALADKHDLPLVAVFTGWFGALRLAASGASPAELEAAYRKAAAPLDVAGMPGLSSGMLPLALLCLRLQHDLPVVDDDWGPHLPWARPHVLLARGATDEAWAELQHLPNPSAGHVQEVLWCLAGRAAINLGDRGSAQRAHAALLPASHEIAGAATGLFTFGSVANHLDMIGQYLHQPATPD